MDTIDEISEKIVQAITNSLRNRRCDSPVHLQFPSLPDYITQLNTSDEQARIASLLEQNEKLSEEIEALHQRLERAGLDSSSVGSNTTSLVALAAAAYRRYAAIKLFKSHFADKK